MRTSVKHFSTGDIFTDFTEKEGKKRSIMSSKNTNNSTIVPTNTGGKKNGRKIVFLVLCGVFEANGGVLNRFIGIKI